MDEDAIKRLYYSISEVSRITGIKPYVLRYWETEFKELRPAKNRAGNRIYRKSDIQLLFQIKKLLYDKKFTIEGARKKLQEMRRGEGNEVTQAADERFKAIISEIKQMLLELLQILDSEAKTMQSDQTVEGREE